MFQSDGPSIVFVDTMLYLAVIAKLLHLFSINKICAVTHRVGSVLTLAKIDYSLLHTHMHTHTFADIVCYTHANLQLCNIEDPAIDNSRKGASTLYCYLVGFLTEQYAYNLQMMKT